MSYIAPATCSIIPGQTASSIERAANRPQPLADFREVRAYVLLGEPGSGKTTAFEAEARQCGGCVVSARSFIALEPAHHPEWQNIVFIDALDEARALRDSLISVFDRLRRRLDQLRPRRIRISCRISAWLPSSDLKHLKEVVSTGQVKVLRLEPLAWDDTVRILRARSDVSDVHECLKRIRELGLTQLLSNPQQLDFIAQVVSRGQTAKTRRDVFELACRHFAHETNGEHRISRDISVSSPSTDDVLTIAGELFAVQLLSRRAGFIAPGEAPKDGYIDPRLIDGHSGQAVWAILATRLFRGEEYRPVSSCVPVHQAVAEFLAARFVSRAIESGVPPQRVLALLMGDETAVPSIQRGLAGWLATESTAVREILIRRDPICLLHGTLDGFSAEDKLGLMRALESHKTTLIGESDRICYAACTALSEEAMAPHLEAILRRSGRSEEDQALVDFVLHVLEQGSRVRRWERVLSSIVLDQSRWPKSRVLALRILTEDLKHGRKAERVKWFVRVQGGEIPDAEGFLLGSLLTMLYPSDLGPAKIWDYLTASSQAAIGTQEFWWNTFSASTRLQDLPIVLDELHAKSADLLSKIEAWSLGEVVLGFLAQALEVYGAKQPVSRLFDWLSAGAGVLVGWDSERDAASRIRRWLQGHEGILKGVVREGLLRPAESGAGNHFHFYWRGLRDPVFGARMPAGFGRWCLSQIDSVSIDGGRAEILLRWAVLTIRNGEGDEGLSDEDVRRVAAQSPSLLDALERRLPSTGASSASTDEEERATGNQAARVRKRIALVRSAVSELRDNRASPRLLFELAKVYFGGHTWPQDGGDRGHLEVYLRHEDELVGAALGGLAGVPDRRDLPTADETIRWAAQGRFPVLGLPLLAGLAERGALGSQSDLDCGSPLARLALSCHYLMGSRSGLPPWYRGFLKECPETASDVLLQYCRGFFRHRRVPHGVLQLILGDGHSDMVRRTCLPLLRSFPLRCKRQDNRSLDELLVRALRVADHTALLELIKHKLNRKSMTVAQRGRWLMAGLVAKPRAYEDWVWQFAREQPDRTPILAESWRGVCRASLHRSPEDRARLSSVVVQLFGEWAQPDTNDDGGWVGPEVQASQAVLGQLLQLQSSSARQAGCILGDLGSDPALAAWHAVIRKIAADRQERVIDERYRPPRPRQVLDVLHDGPPANGADLLAVVSACLDRIRRLLRSSNTDRWKNYWNEDRYGRPKSCKREESCRNVLLEDLRNLLPSGVRAEPESAWFSRKRPDICVICENLQLPVEVKMHPGYSFNAHQEFIRDQLIERYARHTPSDATRNHGVYVILWSCACSRFEDPKALQRALREELSPQARAKIGVHVLDISDPSGRIAPRAEQRAESLPLSSHRSHPAGSTREAGTV
ncbi:MAG: hypothetical protein OXN89_27270 [Bryobacterales bacterium]|nr:hypothetical protein [Bryobacterales bacterium]